MIAADAENENVGFAFENLYLVFAENRVPAETWLFYVPWQ